MGVEVEQELVDDRGTPAVMESQTNESPEDAEIRAIQEAIEAEAKKATEGQGQAVEGDEGKAEATATPEGEAHADEAEQKGKVVPIGAVQAEREKRQEAERKAAFLEGQLAAMQAMQNRPAPAEPETRPPTHQEMLAHLRASKADIAAQFDDGKLSAAEWETQRQTLEDQEWTIRQAMLAPTPAPANDLALQQETAKLEDAYPVLKELSADDLKPLVPLALRKAAADGVVITKDATGTLKLRQYVSQLAQTLYGKSAAATTPASESTGKPAVLSPEALAREAKLKLKDGMPPDVESMGSAASAGNLSDAELEAKLSRMSEDEQIALLDSMPGLLTRVMGHGVR